MKVYNNITKEWIETTEEKAYAMLDNLDYITSKPNKDWDSKSDSQEYNDK